jgi:hypothetical protein
MRTADLSAATQCPRAAEGHSTAPGDGLAFAKTSNGSRSMSRQARITGKVEYREGDGPMIVIRPGPCEVEEGDLDVTISWVDGETHGSTAIPKPDFERYVARKAIELD